MRYWSWLWLWVNGVDNIFGIASKNSIYDRVSVMSWTVCCLYRATHVHCVYIGSQWRLTALGCQNGHVVVAVFDVVSKGTTFIENIDHDAHIFFFF